LAAARPFRTNISRLSVWRRTTAADRRRHLLSRETSITLPVALGNFLSADDSPWELLMTAGFIYALPPAAIHYAFRKYNVVRPDAWRGEGLAGAYPPARIRVTCLARVEA
jgi:hypothetical protein